MKFLVDENVGFKGEVKKRASIKIRIETKPLHVEASKRVWVRIRFII